MNAEQSIRNLQRQIDDLKLAQRNCPHKWSDPVAAHIYIEGYTVPGDPIGTMGIDWRGPYYVPPVTKNRWKRTCLTCGKEEFTERQETVSVKTRPVF